MRDNPLTALSLHPFTQLKHPNIHFNTETLRMDSILGMLGYDYAQGSRPTLAIQEINLE